MEKNMKTDIEMNIYGGNVQICGSSTESIQTYHYHPKSRKFNPKTLKAFDKVLVRDDESKEWTTAFFSFIKGGTHPYQCGTEPFVYCIPWNGATEHLIGSHCDPPEFYRYWEE